MNAINVMAAIVIAILMGASSLLDGPDDIQAAKDVAEWSAELDRVEGIMAKERFLAQLDETPDLGERANVVKKVCASLHGERGHVMQLETGELVCRRITTTNSQVL